MRLPWWFGFVYLGVRLWFLTAPAAILLAFVGWYAADRLGALRLVLFGAAALSALPFAMAALMFAAQTVAAATRRQRLDRDETVAGLELPAGSMVYFADEAHSSVIAVDLPRGRVSDISGMRLTGTLRRFGQNWTCRLGEDQHLDGFPCRAGIAVFDSDGIIQKFTLAAAHELLGLALPRGTMVERGSISQPWTLILPPDIGVHLPALATTAPAGVTLTVANDGQLEGISSGHGQTIIVCGLPLNSKNFQLHGRHVVADLAEPYFVVGEMRAAGTEVRVDLSTGSVSVPGT
jgi:hypothetical protein